MRPDNNEEILTINEIASEWKVHRSTVSRLIKAGELKHYRIGACKRLKRSEVESFFDNQAARESISGKEL